MLSSRRLSVFWRTSTSRFGDHAEGRRFLLQAQDTIGSRLQGSSEPDQWQHIADRVTELQDELE